MTPLLLHEALAEALPRTSLELAAGEVIVVTGLAWQAARALVRVSIGMLELAEGEAWLLGTALAGAPPEARRQLRARCGVVPGYGQLVNNLSVFDNVALPLRYHDLHPEQEVRELVYAALDAASLSAQAPLRPEALNPSQRLRVALARATLPHVELLLLDDFFEDLDESNYNDVCTQIEATRAAGAGVLILTGRCDLDRAFQGVLAQLGRQVCTQ